MAVELPPFAVAPEQIARLGDSFTPFVNQLLDVETAAAGMDGVTLTTTYRVNLADGGVDAGIRRAVETRWLPAGDSAWQFKAGDLSPQKCADELKDAAEALAVLRTGGKYRLVIGAGLTDQKIKTRRAKLIAQAEESLGIKIDSTDDVIEVLDANSLARWVQEYPYLAVSPMLGGIDTVALNYEGWAKSNRHDSIWVPSDSREELKQQIAEFIGGNSQVDLRIEGASGLGKSRAVLESFRGTEYEPLVLYVRAADDLAPNLIPRLLNQDRVGIVVVDDCGGKKHEALAFQLPSGSRLRLITIGEPDGYGVQSPSVRLPALENEVIEEILSQNQPSLWPEARRVVVDHCAGNVRWALRLALGVLQEHPNSAGELLTAEAIRTYVTNELPGGAHFLACSALALFTRIGYDAELANELEAVADMLGLTVTDLRAAARALTDAGLLDKQGRYRSVAPQPLAVYLAGIGWEEFGSRLIDALPEMPPILAERLLRRAAEVGRSEATSAIVERILASGGPFASLAQLGNRNNSQLLIQAAIIAPNEVTRHLADLIGKSSLSELRDATAVRRNLVWALEKLVWHRGTFIDAANSLLRLALAENETFANNATGTWTDLFGAALPGTAARPSERMEYLRSVADSSQPTEIRRLAVRGCARALSAHEMIMVSGENQGGVLIETRGSPRTFGELWEYQQQAIKLTRDLVDDSDAEVAESAVEVLKNAIHPFLTHEQVRDTLFEAVASLPSASLDKIRTEVDHLDRLFRRVADVAGRAEGLEILRSRLPAAEPQDVLSALAHANRWDFDLQDHGELQRQLTLAAEALPGKVAISHLLGLLDDPQLPAAFEVGHALHDVAGTTSTTEALTALLAHGASVAALTGFLYAAVEAGDADAFDEFLDSDVGAELADSVRLAITVRGPRSDAGWARVLEINERLPVGQAAPLLFGWHTNVETDRLIRLLGSWLPRIRVQADYNAAVDFIAIGLHNQEKAIPELDDLVAGLVEGIADFPEIRQQSWNWAQLAKRQIEYAPERLLTTILDLVDRGALTIHRGDEEATVLKEVVRKLGRAALTPVLEKVAGGSWRLEMDVRGWILAEFDPDIVIGWIGGELDRARVVASVVGVPEDGPPTDLVRHLLDVYGEDDIVASSLAGEYISGTHWGPESNVLASQIAHLSSWIDGSESDGVKQWATRIIASLEARRRTVLRREAEEER
ncbi:hypothetical protein AAV95_08895 [Mycolicibacterium elephantis]|uniref:hypothetical protein n=1 Tax=Mycolicibacterium elephantis TaxID=81858 RepID=UPI000629D0EB|nr:hypothetical protein [Mycolicibacterium elephantis]KKW65050.1 hypothetical protein AAV95_08895 [Mycolicibacterium elephantis]